MVVDRLLARFRIQTKVIAFIVPFLASISAVGFSGMYASSLLQTRMDMSNAVLQSLSGFKSVYTGMTDFLKNTNEATRATLTSQVKTQSDLLQNVRAGANSGEGEAEIDAAITGTKAISGQIDQLVPLSAGSHHAGGHRGRNGCHGEAPGRDHGLCDGEPR